MRIFHAFRVLHEDFSKGFSSAVSLQIPLFAGFRNTKSFQKAKLDYKITLDTEKQIRDGINAQVELAFNKFKEAEEKLDELLHDVSKTIAHAVSESIKVPSNKILPDTGGCSSGGSCSGKCS